MNECRLDTNNILPFMLAGKATLTAHNTQSTNRFTFQLKKLNAKDSYSGKPIWWVSVLNGPQNTSDYAFIGTVFTNNEEPFKYWFKYGDKSIYANDAQCVEVFRYILKHAKQKDLPEFIHIYHDGMCGRCGRTLTVPASIKSGFGPECISKVSGLSLKSGLLAHTN